MKLARSSAAVIFLAASGCSTPAANAPSLAPRAAEDIDPRVPIVGTPDTRPVSPLLEDRLSQLVTQANSSDGPFRSAAEEAERLVALAGPRESESWIAAQQAVSAVVAARAPTTKALSDIDALGAASLQAKGELSAADLQAIEAASAEVGALDKAQAGIVDSLQARLGS